MGAYLILYPRGRVNMLFILIRIIPVPAWAVLLWWFLLQVLMGLPLLTQGEPGVAGVGAHRRLRRGAGATTMLTIMHA